MKTVLSVIVLFVTLSLLPVTVFADEDCDFSNQIGFASAGDQSLVVLSKLSQDTMTAGLVFEGYEGIGCNQIWSFTLEKDVTAYSFDVVSDMPILNIAIREDWAGEMYANTIYTYWYGILQSHEVIFTSADEDDFIVEIQPLNTDFMLVGESDGSLRTWNPENGDQLVLLNVGPVIDVAYNGEYAVALSGAGYLYSVSNDPDGNFSWYTRESLLPEGKHFVSVHFTDEVLVISYGDGEATFVIEDGFIRQPFWMR
jgi:WD40 repeat protein